MNQLKDSVQPKNVKSLCSDETFKRDVRISGFPSFHLVSDSRLLELLEEFGVVERWERKPDNQSNTPDATLVNVTYSTKEEARAAIQELQDMEIFDDTRLTARYSVSQIRVDSFRNEFARNEIVKDQNAIRDYEAKRHRRRRRMMMRVGSLVDMGVDDDEMKAGEEEQFYDDDDEREDIGVECSDCDVGLDRSQGCRFGSCPGGSSYLGSSSSSQSTFAMSSSKKTPLPPSSSLSTSTSALPSLSLTSCSDNKSNSTSSALRDYLASLSLKGESSVGRSASLDSSLVKPSACCLDGPSARSSTSPGASSLVSQRPASSSRSSSSSAPRSAFVASASFSSSSSSPSSPSSSASYSASQHCPPVYSRPRTRIKLF